MMTSSPKKKFASVVPEPSPLRKLIDSAVGALKSGDIEARKKRVAEQEEELARRKRALADAEAQRARLAERRYHVASRQSNLDSLKAHLIPRLARLETEFDGYLHTGVPPLEGMSAGSFAAQAMKKRAYIRDLRYFVENDLPIALAKVAQELSALDKEAAAFEKRVLD